MIPIDRGEGGIPQKIASQKTKLSLITLARAIHPNYFYRQKSTG